MTTKQKLNRVLIVSGALLVILGIVLTVTRPENVWEAARDLHVERWGYDGQWGDDGRYHGMVGGRAGIAAIVLSGGAFIQGVVFTGIVILVARAFRRRGHGRARVAMGGDPAEERGIDTLDRLFAAGEIGEDEYRARRDVLRDVRSNGGVE